MMILLTLNLLGVLLLAWLSLWGEGLDDLPS